MTQRPLCIVVTGEPIAAARERVGGGFATMIRRRLASTWFDGYLDVDAASGEPLPAPEAVAGFIITGSPASVTERAPWMLRAEGQLAEIVQRGHAVLGICFGHQLLGQALGGRVEKNLRGEELGTMAIELFGTNPLFASAPPTLAHFAHSDSVTRLPPGAQLLARSALEPHAAARFGERAWGVQFHPEFDEDVMRDYLDERRSSFAPPDPELEAAARNIRHSALGSELLPNFVRQAVSRR